MRNDVPESKKKRLDWKVKVVGYVFMAVLCLGVLELASYLYLRHFLGYDGHHLMSYQFDDYKNIRLTPGYRNTRGVFHNLQGFRRSTDTARIKPAGVYRIFLMGGSAAYGLQSLSRYADPTTNVFKSLKERGLAFGLPTSILVDRKGCTIGIMQGPAEWDSEDAKALIGAAITIDQVS